MESERSELGRWGEKQAARFLKTHGYRILEKNYVSSVGEIDIVARDGDVLVFVEVKTRTDEELGGPLEAVGRAKRRKLALVARSFLQRHKLDDISCRFDVVGVTRAKGQKEPDIELVREAFTLGGH